MKGIRFSLPLAKVVAMVLCLCFVAPIGWAAEPAGQAAPVRESDAVASAPASTAPESPQALSAEEVTDLSERAEEPGPEVAGGALSNTHLTYIVIALAAAVIVLIAK